MAQAIPAVTGSMLLSFEYDPTGLEWAILHDNPVLAWVVDEAGTTNPKPIILGSLPPAAADTGEVLSPAFAAREGGPAGTWFIPDMVRGTASELFNFIASNNGADRKLYANFADTSLIESWNQWVFNNSQALIEKPQ
jgi:hypothetical protein